MADSAFRPTLYLYQKCPFCLKLVIFLSEAGLLDRFDMKAFAVGSDEEREVRAMLAPHFEKVTFPAAQVAPGEFLKDSDALIEYYRPQATEKGGRLLDYYTSGVLQHVRDLFMENMELKKQLA